MLSPLEGLPDQQGEKPVMERNSDEVLIKKGWGARSPGLQGQLHTCWDQRGLAIVWMGLGFQVGFWLAAGRGGWAGLRVKKWGVHLGDNEPSTLVQKESGCKTELRCVTQAAGQKLGRLGSVWRPERGIESVSSGDGYDQRGLLE